VPPPGTTDVASVVNGVGKNSGLEIKEWQAIMDYLRKLPATAKGKLPIIPVDERATEVRAIKVG
jgi:5'-nucleotidase